MKFTFSELRKLEKLQQKRIQFKTKKPDCQKQLLEQVNLL